jgi:excinuclease ABC subunit C
MSDPTVDTDQETSGPGATGVAAIKVALATMPGGPGVYRMLAEDGAALYVGKARSLKKRVAAYTQLARLPIRLQRMVAETRSMEIVVTHTEGEALLLESNLIKRLMPRYNVLLRDDKSFPYVALFEDHEYPQIAKHRGARDRPASYYGPFASAGAVNQTLTALQRGFLLRSCPDTVFANRTRPCLLYQIKRCSAPCVGRITAEDYARLVSDAKAFFAGRSRGLQDDLARKMQSASEAQDYETAALFRDRIRALTTIQARQGINVEALGDADVIAAHQAGGATCIQVFFFRGGFNYGNRAYFPRHDKQQDTVEVLNAFVGQFYADRPPPKLVLLSADVPDRELLCEALSEKAGFRVRVEAPERGDKRKPIDHALANAREALARRLAESGAQAQLLEGVAQVFGLDGAPRRIEVYDNSHIGGTQALGAMIVAGPEGFAKNQYRKFNIRGTAALPSPPPGGERVASDSEPGEAGLAPPADTHPPHPQSFSALKGGEGLAAPITPGDDYAMLREVLTRRFGRAVREDPARASETWPDLVLIDGGQGQLSVAQEVMAELGLNEIPLVAIAKGPDRDAGRERFFMSGREPFQLEPRDPILYFLQRLRDEAHRFAIGGHRSRRSAAIARSPLDDVAGIGPRRKKALLMHFGSGQAVARAGLADLENVPGISKTVAKKVYDHFHGEG